MMTSPRSFLLSTLGRSMVVGSTAFVIAFSTQAPAAAPAVEQVELFAAADEKQIDLKVVPKDATQATVLIKNNTKRPLSIKLPSAFAGMPVLAQDRGGNIGGGNTSTSTNQSFGGGFGGGGFGGGMGGFFDVGPERVGKLKVTTVCLEHGKDDPTPRVPYELKPIAEFTDNVEVHELCRMLGQGQLDQASAQAAAWHLTDGLTLQQLAQKVRVKHLNGQVEMYFNPRQLTRAVRAVQVARHRAEQREGRDAAALESRSPGEVADAEAKRDALSRK